MKRTFTPVRQTWALLILLALVVAACGSDDDNSADTTAPTETTAPPAAETTTTATPADPVTVTMWSDDMPVNECEAEQLRSSFVHDYISLEITHHNQVWDVVRTAVAGGGGPDVVTTPGPSFVFELAQAGSVIPLDGYATSLAWGDSIVDWALNLGIVNGQLYSLPTQLETIVLYYNKTLFETNGWEVPSTIDEMTALSETIAAAGINPFSHSNAEWRPANEWFFSAFINNIAGPENVYAALRGEKPWTDQEFLDAVSLLNEYQQNGWFSGGLDNYYTLGNEGYLSAFGDGEGAMNIEGSWRLESIHNYFGEAAGNNNEWDWAPFPSSSGDPTFSIGIGSTYSINQASEIPDEAAQVISHIFLPKTQALLAVNCGLAPAPVRLSADMLAGIDERDARLYATIAEASDAGNYGYLTWTFWPPQSDVYIYEEIEKVWSGDITPAEYLEGLNTLFQTELEAGDTPPLPAR